MLRAMILDGEGSLRFMLGDGGRNLRRLSSNFERVESRWPVMLGEGCASSECSNRTGEGCQGIGKGRRPLNGVGQTVVEILSIRDNPGRSPAREGGGRWANCGEDWREAARVLLPPDCGEPRRSSGDAWRVVDSSVVKGDSKSRVRCSQRVFERSWYGSTERSRRSRGNATPMVDGLSKQQNTCPLTKHDRQWLRSPSFSHPSS